MTVGKKVLKDGETIGNFDTRETIEFRDAGKKKKLETGEGNYLPNQSNTIVSSSVQAGEAAHEKPLHPRPSLNMSPRILG